MLKDIISIFGLIKGAPPPVDIYALPPLPSPLPVELREKLGEKDDPYCGLHPIHIGIENLSNVVLKQIRVKLPAPSNYQPIVENRDSQRPIEWKNLSERAEIHIESLDPSDSAHIVVFPSEAKAKDFGKPEILIDGKRISSLQEQLGFLKKEPFLVFTMLLFLVVICGAIFSMAFAFYPNMIPNSDRALIEQATERLSGGCSFKSQKVIGSTRNEILSSPLPQQILLQANNATSIDDLLKRDKIVLCK